MSKSIKRVGVYPGTFDPMTAGHVDIIRRSMRLVDELVIGVAIAERKGPLFSLEERVEMIEEVADAMKGDGMAIVRVEPFNNLLVQLAKDVGASVIIRGLRTVTDFEYEYQMVGMNSQLEPDIETVCLMAEAAHQAVSSTLVKEIAKMGGDISHFVVPSVEERVLKKLGR
jgi:pantetheine-phosphate adenylyltransferase